MPIFTAIATAALGAIGLGGTFLVSADTEPSIEFDPAHKKQVHA